MKKQTLSAILLIVAVTFYRLVVTLNPHAPWLENFSPMAAVALCGAIFLPGTLGFIVPRDSVLISDYFLDRHYAVSFLSGDLAVRLLAYGAIIGIGLMLRGRSRALLVLPAAFGASLLFYVVTNTSAWLASPVYAKTLNGWFQALTFGAPGFPHTWTFFESSVISDLLFTGLFLLCLQPRASSAEPAASRSLSPVSQTRN